MKENFNTQNEQEFNGKYIDSDREKKNIKRKKNSTSKIIMNVADTQYPVVKFVGKKIMKWNLDYNSFDQLRFDICWTDNAVKSEFLSKMQLHQKINHFPGMSVLSRKNNLGKNLMKLRKKEPDQYNFFPITFILPTDYPELKIYHQNKKPGKAQTFIVKPEASSQGRGIYLTRNIQRIKQNEKCVVQRYLHKPFLIEGLKFDFRIYVLISGTDPLRLYVYEEGLARFATQPYVAPKSENLDQICMHLTNYAINKQSPNFIFNQSTKDMNVGHKRSLTSVYQYLQSQNYNVEELKERINDIIIKTFISGYPVLNNTYKSCQPNSFSNNMCFQLLGFDIIIDSKFNPILLEINYTPSFSTDTPLDSLIKKNAIKDTLKLLNINQKNQNELKIKRDKEIQERMTTGKRKKYTEQQKMHLSEKARIQRDEYQSKNLGGFQKIYPIDKQQVKKYERLFKYSQQIHDSGNTSTSNTVLNQKKLEFQKNVSKIYTASIPHAESNLKKDNSTKIKSRQANSMYKKSKVNLSNDKLIVSNLDVGENQTQVKSKLKMEGNKSNNKKTIKYIKQQVADAMSEQIHLFSNQNLKQIISLTAKDENMNLKKAFSKKKPLHFKQ